MVVANNRKRPETFPAATEPFPPVAATLAYTFYNQNL
jgi:hypothetical protein